VLVRNSHTKCPHVELERWHASDLPTQPLLRACHG